MTDLTLLYFVINIAVYECTSCPDIFSGLTFHIHLFTSGALSSSFGALLCPVLPCCVLLYHAVSGSTLLCPVLPCCVLLYNAVSCI